MLVRFLYFVFKKRWLAYSKWDTFILAGGALACSLLAVNAFMSLTHNAHLPAPRTFVWTYLSEERYLMFVEFFVFIMAIRLLFIQPNRTFRYKKLLQVVFVIFVLIDRSHTAYFLAKQYLPRHKNFTIGIRETPIVNLIDQVIQENKQKNIDVVVANMSMSNYSLVKGGKALFEAPEINRPDIQASRPTLLIALIRKPDLPSYLPFINKPGVQLMKVIKEWSIYAYYVGPTNKL